MKARKKPQKWIFDELRFILRWGIWLPIASIILSLLSGGITYLIGLGGWIAAVIAISGSALGMAIYAVWRLLPLRGWLELTQTTDLVGFERANKDSPYMPSKILEREEITHLWVMGNGCSKWTKLVPHRTAVAKFKQIRRGGGKIRFLASCPVKLNNTGDQAKREKAKKNADSLLVLRKFKSETDSAGGTFEIRTYKHTATLRLIIVDEEECIVGHYTESGIDDSLDTPLLIFSRTNDNPWGFGHAFHRLFDSEWHRAGEPTADEWTQMEQLRSMSEKST
jgi:hypothetical protein